MIEIDNNGYYKIECICLKDDFHFNNKIYKDKIYTCKGHINSDYYYSVRSGDKYYGIFKKEIFKPLAEWRDEQINKILEDD